MRRLKKILMACILIAITVIVAITLISNISRGEENIYTSDFKNHPAMELLGVDNESEYCKIRYGYITESKYFASFNVYMDITDDQLLQIAEFVELIQTGKCYKTSGMGYGEIVKSSLIFYKEDTDEVIDCFVYKNGERIEPSEDDVFLPAYMNKENMNHVKSEET